jgi:hypothetical protein
VSFALLYFQAPLEVPGQPGASPIGRTPGMLGDVMLVMGAIFCLLMVLLFWAKHLRRRSRHHFSSRVSSRVIEGEGAGGEGGSPHHHHRHRRHRRDHRPRNPTLAETGGLPPPRPEDQAPPSA